MAHVSSDDISTLYLTSIVHRLIPAPAEFCTNYAIPVARILCLVCMLGTNAIMLSFFVKGLNTQVSPTLAVSASE
jgi:hypothetical protein